MRTKGSLIKWNVDRGFGFVKTRDSGIEVFVHISEFPRSGRTPQIGDILHFDIATGQDGRKQAKAVTFDTPLTAAESTPARIARAPAARTPPAREPPGHRQNPRRDTRRDRPRRESSGLGSKVVVGTLLLVGAAFGYQKFAAFQTPTIDMSQVHGPQATTTPATTPGYACDGRQHCSQMRSCEEATWFIQNCPNTKMDGEGDGIPCEQQHCN